MPKHESRIRVNEHGTVVYLSVIHPIGDDYFLIEQKVDEEGNITYFTNEIQEHMIGKINSSSIETDGKEIK